MANMPSLKCGKFAIFCVLNKSEANCNKIENKTLEWIKSYFKVNAINQLYFTFG